MVVIVVIVVVVEVVIIIVVIVVVEKESYTNGRKIKIFRKIPWNDSSPR